MTDQTPTAASSPPSLLTGLSARLLVLTIFFVMVAEFLIYTPSVSNFRKKYLEERIATAHVAALALEATPDNMVSPELEEELLYHAGAYGVVLRHPTRRVLMLSKEMPPKVDVTFDLRSGRFPYWIFDAYEAMFRDDNRIMRVVGMSPKQPGVIVEAVLDEAPMRAAMLGFSTRILQLSIVISLLTSVVMLFVVRFCSDQTLVKRRRNRLAARVLELLVYSDDIAVNLSTFRRILVANPRQHAGLVFTHAVDHGRFQWRKGDREKQAFALRVGG